MTDIQNLKLTQKIQIAVIKDAIFNMENGKSTVIDGLSIEFFKEFFELIKFRLQNIYNKTLFDIQIAPKLWNQYIITLIPKKGNTKYLKYWGPISLLCVDCKILTKILANCLKGTLMQI